MHVKLQKQQEEWEVQRVSEMEETSGAESADVKKENERESSHLKKVRK